MSDVDHNHPDNGDLSPFQIDFQDDDNFVDGEIDLDAWELCSCEGEEEQQPDPEQQPEPEQHEAKSLRDLCMAKIVNTIKHDDPRLREASACLPRTIREEIRDLRDPEEVERVEHQDQYQMLQNIMIEDCLSSGRYLTHVWWNEREMGLDKGVMMVEDKLVRKKCLKDLFDRRERILSQIKETQKSMDRNARCISICRNTTGIVPSTMKKFQRRKYRRLKHLDNKLNSNTINFTRDVLFLQRARKYIFKRMEIKYRF